MQEMGEETNNSNIFKILFFSILLIVKLINLLILGFQDISTKFEFKIYIFLHCAIILSNILKGKRNAYFEFLNVGFILRTLFFLISAIFTNKNQQLNSATKFCIFCWWRVPFVMTSLPRTGAHWLYVKDIRARKRMSFEGKLSLSKFPP